jgi:Glycosyltransferase family 87
MPLIGPAAISTASRRGRFFNSDLSPRAVLIGLMLLVSCLYFNLAETSYLDDFRAFYVAGLATHDHLDPYVNHVDLDERYADALWVRADSRYIYPPTALFFLSPLSRLPYKYAKLLFAMLIVLTMVGILDFFHRRYPGQIPVLFALFVSLPMITNIDTGNTDVLILALLLAAFYLEDGWKAGLCLGIAVAIKFAPVVAVVWFLGNRRWRTAVWAVVVSGVLAAAALARWGAGYYSEFLHHLVAHADPNRPRVAHQFTTLKMFDGFLLTPQGTFAFQHDICGYVQNPLRYLGKPAGAVGVALLIVFFVWLFGSVRGRALNAEQSFFLFLVVSLLANHLLWPMGLVACFPLLILLVDSAKTPNLAALLLLAPLMMTVQLVGQLNFTVWMIVAGYWVFRNGWLRGAASRSTLEFAS